LPRCAVNTQAFSGWPLRKRRILNWRFLKSTPARQPFQAGESPDLVATIVFCGVLYAIALVYEFRGASFAGHDFV
jgi:hypothetical protein